MSETQTPQAETRCGFVAVIGAPNSGKSTLTNALVGAKVAIVTHKAQTTRGPVLGIALEGKSQIILIDTPGIFHPKRRLDRAMGDRGLGAGGRCRPRGAGDRFRARPGEGRPRCLARTGLR